ncbi:MAG TPA: hypothetical protein VLZ89_10090 [Anaerolineales bacterium]|nr:hypothetical protein [Anaerolineales bacterium]
MISIRKLAAVDMAWLGTRVIVTEYALGVILPFLLGLLSLRSGLRDPKISNGEIILGIWLVTIAANYIPLFIYAVLIAKAGTVKEEGQPEIANAKRYGIQQIIILVPFLVVIAAIVQELRQGGKR